MAPVEFNTRGLWKNEFYRLTDTASDDGALIEHDDASQEGVHAALQVGLDSAQDFLLASGLNGWWTGRGSAITSWSGADATDGGRYKALPSDFVRLACDVGQGCFVTADGSPWGQLVAFQDRRARGDGYYLKDDLAIWLLHSAQPPATVYLEYIHRLSVPDADGTAFTDFPARALSLIPAFAAEYAMNQAWLPGGEEMRGKIRDNLMRRRQEALFGSRQYTGPRRTRASTMLGNHY